VKRRAALGALLGLGCGAFARGGSPPVGVLAWDDEGIWVAAAGATALQLLAGANPSLGVAPVAVTAGVWALSEPRRLARWQPVGERWVLASACDFEAPVHALQASADGRFALAAHGEQLSLVDAQGTLVRRYDGSDLARRHRGRATVLQHMPQRRSFVVAWDGLAEWWEISLDPAAAPVFDGLVHDYRMGEAIATAGYLGVRRIPLERPLPQLGFADARVAWAAAVRDGQVQIIHLDVRRRIAQWPLPDAAPQAALLRREADAWVWWLPAGRVLQRVDTGRWSMLSQQSLSGRVLSLQAVGDRVWALGTHGGVNRLSAWQGQEWLPLPLPSGEPLALQADGAGQWVLVALHRPARLLALQPSAAVQREWNLPPDVALRAVRWMPAPP
jgi:hypothetical protein